MIQVLIAGSTRIYRDGLSKVLRFHPSLNVCATAATASETERQMTVLRPHVLLIDIAMEGAMQVIRTVRTLDPEIKVVALAIADCEAEIISWAEAGVSGFVTRDNSLDELVEAIVAVAKGELACSRRQAATLLHHVAKLSVGRPNAVAPPSPILTRRQIHIAQLVSTGLSNKEIAQKLGIEVTTVKNHVHQLLGKLNVKRRGQIAAIAREFAADKALSPN